MKKRHGFSAHGATLGRCLALLVGEHTLGFANDLAGFFKPLPDRRRIGDDRNGGNLFGGKAVADNSPNTCLGLILLPAQSACRFDNRHDIFLDNLICSFLGHMLLADRSGRVIRRCRRALQLWRLRAFCMPDTARAPMPSKIRLFDRKACLLCMQVLRSAQDLQSSFCAKPLCWPSPPADAMPRDFPCAISILLLFRWQVPNLRFRLALVESLSISTPRAVRASSKSTRAFCPRRNAKRQSYRL